MKNNDSVIFTRRSIRAYDATKKATKEQIVDLLNAGMHAPSAMNKQPWEFVVATESDAISAIMQAHPYCESLKDAGTAIIVCGDLEKQFQIPDGGYYAYDCSAVTQNILLRAKELGLGTCWCGIAPEKERIAKVQKALNLPKHIEPMSLIIVGTPAEDPTLEEPRYDEKKVHWQKW